jgi:helicase
VSGKDAQPNREASTVADIMQARWGVRPPLAVPRLAQPGWSYEEPVPAECPRCRTPLHCLRRPYESAGKQYRYIALVCPSCPAAFTLPDLGYKTYQDMMKSAGSRTRPAPQPEQGRQPESPQTDGPAGRPKARRDQRLFWVKLGHPGETPLEPQRGVDLRVLLPDDTAFDQVRSRMATRGVPARAVRYWLESEVVSSVTLDGQPGRLAASCALSNLAHTVGKRALTNVGAAAEAARDAFDLIWQEHAEDGPPAAEHVAAGGLSSR